jgi:hypothetical protein
MLSLRKKRAEALFRMASFRRRMIAIVSVVWGCNLGCKGIKTFVKAALAGRERPLEPLSGIPGCFETARRPVGLVKRDFRYAVLETTLCGGYEREVHYALSARGNRFLALSPTRGINSAVSSTGWRDKSLGMAIVRGIKSSVSLTG